MIKVFLITKTWSNILIRSSSFKTTLKNPNLSKNDNYTPSNNSHLRKIANKSLKLKGTQYIYIH